MNKLLVFGCFVLAAVVATSHGAHVVVRSPEEKEQTFFGNLLDSVIYNTKVLTQMAVSTGLNIGKITIGALANVLHISDCKLEPSPSNCKYLIEACLDPKGTDKSSYCPFLKENKLIESY